MSTWNQDQSDQYMPLALNPYPLEIQSNGGLKQEHLKSSTSATKIYLHYHNDYGHQTWQGGDLSWGVPTHKITRLFDHVVLQDH